MHCLDHDEPAPPFEQWLLTIDPDLQRDDKLKPARNRVRCRACLNYLTSNDHLTPIGGETCHFFSNPEGIGFDLQTYHQVDGVELGGQPTEYFTWFEGFAWQHCFCKRCHQHIGWYFSCEGASGFYALITDRLLLD